MSEVAIEPDVQYFARSIGEESPQNVVLIADPIVLGSIAEGLALRGYNTKGWNSEPAPIEWLGRLARQLVSQRPNAAVLLVHYALEDALLKELDGIVPTVVLQTINRPHNEAASTTVFMHTPTLFDPLTDSLRQVIDAYSARQE